MATNFANLTSPQRLAIFDSVLGSVASATQGAGAIGYNPSLSYGAGTVGAALKSSFIVYATQFGAQGGGADDTVALQSFFTCGAKLLVLNAGMVFTTSGNDIPSGVNIVFQRGAQLRLANNANRPVLQNINFKSSTWGGATYGLDTDITIYGLNIDGNQANQIHTGVNPPYTNEFTSGVRFFGVTRLTLINTQIHQARTFAIWLCAIDGLTVRDLLLDQYMGGAPDNQDGLHINGPARNLDIRNVRGSTNDDMVALNADDGPLGANFTTGPITNAVIDGVYPVACLNGVRLLSATSRMDQITVRSVKGSTRDVAVNQSPFGLGVGNVGTLTIEDIDVRCSNNYQPTSSNYYSVITLDGIIDVASVKTVKNNRPADNRPALLIPGTANIGALKVDGMEILEVAGSTLSGVRPIRVIGRVDTLMVDNASYFRDSSLTQTGNFLSLEATGNAIGNVICSNWIVERLSAPIAHTDGTLGSITLHGIIDKNGLPGGQLLGLASAVASTTDATIAATCQTDFGRLLLTRSGSSVFGSRTTIAGASGASASLPSNQSLTSATYTQLNFSTLIYDRVTGEYSIGSKNFTVSQGPGIYAISVMVDLATPTNPTDIVIGLYKAGSLYRVMPGTGRVTATAAILGGTALVSVAQGDVFDIRVFCTANCTANATANSVVSYERFK